MKAGAREWRRGDRVVVRLRSGKVVPCVVLWADDRVVGLETREFSGTGRRIVRSASKIEGTAL